MIQQKLSSAVRHVGLFTLLLLLITKIVTAQTLNFNQFSIEDGLPQSGINCLVQDSVGTIWIGTMSGVSKYNGIKFENFNKKNGLAENRVVSSCIDTKKNIWFGHWAGGISVYITKTKTFKHILPNDKTIDIFKTINCIYQDKSENIWFGTGGQGLMRLDVSDYNISDDTAKIAHLNFKLIRKNEGLSSDIINSIGQDGDYTLWVGTDAGVTKIKHSGVSKYIYDHLDITNGLPSNTITSVLCDSKRRIWLGSIDKGIFRLGAPDDKKIKVYNTEDGLSSNDINVIFEDIEHHIFIGTFGGGVSKYLPALESNNYKGPIFQTISTQQGLSNDKVLSILQDREKNIWIGTYLNLNQYFEEQFEIYGINEGLENSLVWSVMQDKEDNFWLGTEGGLIKFMQGKNANENEFTYYTAYAVSGKKGKTTATTALYEDAEGKIWFTNYGNGVSRLDPKTKKITNYTTKDGLLSNEIFSITGDKDNNIWIGTNKGGVAKFDLATKKFTNYTTTEGLGSNYVYCIFKDSKNRLWFGSLGGELTVYDPSSVGASSKTFKKIGEKDGYKNKFTVCITEDSNGNIWLGSYDGGIYKYNGETFQNYSSRNGLNAETPFLMICDNKSNLWIGTNLGIDKFNLNDETFKHYGREDGFLGIEINPNAVCKDNGGNLWFGTIIGVVKYNSKREKSNLTEPITHLQDPRIDFEKANIPSDHVFSYFQNHLTFDFVGASLTNPGRVRYKYMLEGMDEEWSPVTKDNYVTYPSIQPGTYTFKVMAANNDGIWNKKPETFTFTISPPWWKTTWFYVITTILVVMSVFTYFRWRERKLRETNRILEEKVNLRTRELRKEKEVVEAQRGELKEKNERILDSINAAQGIQGIILPPEQSIKKLFTDAFVFYKPKDIVSGDFYWIHQERNLKYFAAVDCAGHGVPGAFMTMLGYSFFENAINEAGVKDPASILNKVHKDLLAAKQKYSLTDIKTGMDVALIALDEAKGEIIFAGARNPLYVVRNGELTEIKGNRQTIGINAESHTGSGALIYENHTYPIQKGDLLYVFSDGFPDQKGGLPGVKATKFFYQPFRELFQSISKKPMEEQRKILDETITNWRGDRFEQIDDVLVMGIKV